MQRWGWLKWFPQSTPKGKVTEEKNTPDALNVAKITITLSKSQLRNWQTQYLDSLLNPADLLQDTEVFLVK